MRTRLAKKRKIKDLINNTPTKKARIKQMTELAEEYSTIYEKCGNNHYNCFNYYYKEKLMIYPWLDKENLRWHFRKHLNSKKNEEPKEIEQEISHNATKCQVSLDT